MGRDRAPDAGARPRLGRPPVRSMREVLNAIFSVSGVGIAACNKTFGSFACWGTRACSAGSTTPWSWPT